MGRQRWTVGSLVALLLTATTVVTPPPATAHDPAQAAALALESSRVALHPQMLDAVGYPLYHRLQREIGTRPVFVVILPASSARLSAARELREIEEAFGRSGIYLLSLGDGEPERVVDTRGQVGQVTPAKVAGALADGVDPEASYRAGLLQSVRAVVAAADGRVVRPRSSGPGWRWVVPWVLGAAVVGALVVVVRLRVRARHLASG